MPSAKGKCSQKQLAALKAGREKMCSRMDHQSNKSVDKMIDDYRKAIPPKPTAPTAAPKTAANIDMQFVEHMAELGKTLGRDVPFSAATRQKLFDKFKASKQK